MVNKELNITGKKALLAWNRIGTILAENGVEQENLARDIIATLVEEELIDGEFYVSGHAYVGNVSVKKLHADAVVPHFAHATDAGADLISVENVTLAPYSRAMVGTGLAIVIPKGKVGLVHPRSGLAAKEGITVLNTPGTIDSGYRGEVKVILYNTTDKPYEVKVGDRIAQLVIQNHDFPLFVEVAELPESDRGEGGFGSTGKN